MDDSTAEKNPREETAGKTTRSVPFWLAIFLFASYVLFLICLAFATANPVLINARQIENSELVFVGQVLNAEDIDG